MRSQRDSEGKRASAGPRASAGRRRTRGCGYQEGWRREHEDVAKGLRTWPRLYLASLSKSHASPGFPVCTYETRRLDSVVIQIPKLYQIASSHGNDSCETEKVFINFVSLRVHKSYLPFVQDFKIHKAFLNLFSNLQTYIIPTVSLRAL